MSTLWDDKPKKTINGNVLKNFLKSNKPSKEKRNIGKLLKLTTDEMRKLEKMTKESGFDDSSTYIRFRLFYDNPVFNYWFTSKLEKLLLEKKYRRVTRFMQSIRKGEEPEE